MSAPAADRPRPRFFDSRAAYMMFVTATTEKEEVAARVAREAERVAPGPDALRVFDAGMGDATVLTNVMRMLHERFTHVPWLIVGKEISLEDVRQALDRLPDRLHEHPEMVFVITNMTYLEAPGLRPAPGKPEMSWRRTALLGSTTLEFTGQLRELYEQVTEDWRVETSPRTGNPVYVTPVVHVIYRQDREFILRRTLPRPDSYQAAYDLVIASQPYRARTSAEHKVRTVIGPLAEALAPGGRLLGIHGYGRDPGMEIIHHLWPDENPFRIGRRRLLAEADRLTPPETGLRTHPLSDEESLFRYELKVMPAEAHEHFGTSSIMAAWNAAVYVAQIDEERVAQAVSSGAYLEAVRTVIERRGGVWFNDESYVISRTGSET